MIDKLIKQIENIWYDRVVREPRFTDSEGNKKTLKDITSERMTMVTKVAVWKEEPEGEEPYWCESYSIGGPGLIAYTGRAGFILQRNIYREKVGAYPFLITLNGKEISEEKLYEVLNFKENEI